MNIVIIGAGQLGSRHLQGLALLEEEFDIFIVDPSLKSLEISKQRFEEVDLHKNKVLHLLSSVEDLPENITFAIISTTSKHRLNSMKFLLDKSRVKYLLLEKFLFPFDEEYYEAIKILDSVETKAYVNCGRRRMQVYQNLKEKIGGLSINLIVSGTLWNMGSNSIHFLDLYHYLTNDMSYDLDIENSSLSRIRSKHNGYSEFVGQITLVSDNGKINLQCSEEIKPFKVEINTNKETYLIDELNKNILINGEEFDFNFPPQSQTTNQILKELLEMGNCGLINFEESVKLHLVFLNVLNELMNGEEGIIT